MKIFSPCEAESWLFDRGLSEITMDSLLREFHNRLSYSIPVDTGKKTILARSLIDFLRSEKEGLLWITEWKIWPSCENMNLFDAYRKSLGEVRPIWEAPIHIFHENDLREVECLLDLALYFFWGGFVVDGSKRVAINFSHDEWIDLYAKQEEDISRFKDIGFE